VNARSPRHELALVFLRLGTTAFGGPAAHVAFMEDEVVRRRQWITRERFLDYLAAANLIPGPNSTELAIHIGRDRAGWAGLLIAGACFIAPATIIVTACAWAYVRYGALPVADALFYGIKPVVIAVIAQAIWRLGRAALRSAGTWSIAIAAAVATALGIHELAVLGAAAATSVVALSRRRVSAIAATGVAAGGGAALNAAAASASAAASFSLLHLFGIFVKIGSVLFGSGYVLLAFLRADLVQRLGWLTEPQLIDAVAVGQLTPGPVFTTATFIGYLLGGYAGAAVATAGIFLPAFVFVAASGPIVPRLRRSRTAAAVLDGVNAASLALMAVVGWQLARAAVVDPITATIGVASLLALLFSRVNSAWLILAGALVGAILH
jgi:chromate transporter